MRAVHQVIVGASRRDAITNMALAMRDSLRTKYKSEVYSFHPPDESVLNEVIPLEKLAWGKPNDVLLYHSSFGIPRLTSMLQTRSEKLALVYHNITPSSYYLGNDPEFAAALQWGRHELSLLQPLVSAAFADSQFNAEDLAQYGYTDVVQLAAGVNPFRLKYEPTDSRLIGELHSHFPDGFILAVSQVIPHKRMELAIDAVHLLRTVHRLDVGLVIAGPLRNVRYARDLAKLRSRLPEANVLMMGETTESQLATLYRTCALYFGTSDHEGLAIPPLEAMAAGAPVVIRGVGAVSETVGDAALVAKPEATLCELTEMLHAVLTNNKLRATLVMRGREHVRNFYSQDTTQVFLQRINELTS
jgi:glycosyltransferase involved in cell wall biosynthesis